jgi:signal transduction histidine kinase
MPRNNGAVLGALVAVVAILAAVILLARDNSSVVAFIGVVSPTIVALLGLMKVEAVQNQVSAVQGEVAELTNGKMDAAVRGAVETAIAPVVESLEHVTEDLPVVAPRDPNERTRRDDPK